MLLHVARATVLSCRWLFVTCLAAHCLLFAFLMCICIYNNIYYMCMHILHICTRSSRRPIPTILCTVILAAPDAVAFSKDTFSLHYISSCRVARTLLRDREQKTKIRVDIQKKNALEYRKRRAVNSGLLYYHISYACLQYVCVHIIL